VKSIQRPHLLHAMAQMRRQCRQMHVSRLHFTAVLKTLALHNHTPPVKIHFAMITHPRTSSNVTPPSKCSVFSSPLCPALGELRLVVGTAPTALFSALRSTLTGALRAYGSTAAIWTCRDEMQSALGQACIKPMVDSPRTRRHQPLCVQVSGPPTIALRYGMLRYRYIQRSVPSQRFLANDRTYHLATTFCASALVNISVIDSPGLPL
jgi:hypothetical protein